MFFYNHLTHLNIYQIYFMDLKESTLSDFSLKSPLVLFWQFTYPIIDQGFATIDSMFLPHNKIPPKKLNK
jgi:hypothetical protein